MRNRARFEFVVRGFVRGKGGGAWVTQVGMSRVGGGEEN